MYRERLYLPDHLPNEKVEFVLRRHLFVAFGEGLLFIVLFAIPVGFYYFFKILFPHLLASEVVYTLLLLSVSVYYLYILLFAYTSFIDYWLDIWVVTNERIISIEQRGLFARKFSEQQLFLLQDVSSEVHGILATLFHFGILLPSQLAQNRTPYLNRCRGLTRLLYESCNSLRPAEKIILERGSFNYL
ncbi:MAG: hypothetical protein WC480_01215 [Patescibacteria group bacterium]